MQFYQTKIPFTYFHVSNRATIMLFLTTPMTLNTSPILLTTSPILTFYITNAIYYFLNAIHHFPRTTCHPTHSTQHHSNAKVSLLRSDLHFTFIISILTFTICGDPDSIVRQQTNIFAVANSTSTLPN
jgi:hypothetical protein